VPVLPEPSPHAAAPGASDAALERLLCVVSHTHWDREWYHPAARFRVRLLALVDAILDEADEEDQTPFLLDGQAIVLEDYLAWRPDRWRAVQDALRAGKIEAGPWYVLADNFIVSGEAIIRNLEAGARKLAALGATAPPVAWCPDSFGHPAAMPIIARGFGLDVGVVWRGLGGPAHPDGDSLIWQGPDGSTLPIWHLPRDGYEYGSALPVHTRAAEERWQRLKHEAIARARTSVVLLTNGADHHARQPDLPEALRALREAAAADGVAVQAMGLSAWARHFGDAAQRAALPAVQGELRNSSGYTWSLGGTLATRAHQKRRNARLERGLLRDVEPWLALIRLHAVPGASPAPLKDARLSMAQLPAVLAQAWETLLRTHPHDTLCGCSVDDVARQMEARQDEAAAMGQELRHAALCLLLQHDVVAARARRDFDWRRVVLRNRAPRPRGGVARVRLVHHVADEAVGPGSAVTPKASGAQVVLEADTLRVGGLTQQVLRRSRQRVRRESPQHYPDNDWALVQDTLLWVPPLPPGGLQVLDAHGLRDIGGQTMQPQDPVWAKETGERHEGTKTYSMGNARARCTVRIAADGLAQVSWQVDDRALDDALWIETREDVGDSYTPAPRGVAERLRCTGARVLAAGPLRATLRLRYRTERAPHVHVHVDLMLDADSTLLQLDLRGHVQRPDQRLHLVLRSDVTQALVWADAALGPVRREIEPQPPSALMEAAPPGMPMHRWAAVCNVMRGFTCIADGLAEVEARVSDGPTASLALTLVRGTGALSRADLPERPGHAGWPVDTPEAQCLGPFAARAALMLHGPMNDDTLARVRDACDDVLLPLTGEGWPDLDTTQLSPRVAGVALAGEAFEQSAVTLSSREPDAVVLRAVNLTTRHAMGAWQLPDAGPWLVTPCRLDETPVAESYVSSGQVLLDAGPREVITVRVRRVAHPTTLPTPSPPPR